MNEAPRITVNHMISSAWHAQLDEAAMDSRLKRQQLLYREDELLPRFAQQYQQLTALSRQMRRSLQRQWKLSLGAIALSLALGTAPAMAATINVGARCTLASAINAANMDTPVRGCARGRGLDRIALPPRSVHQPSGVNNMTYGPTGLPVITSAITIAGNGSTIRRAPTAPAFGILAVGATGNLTLQSTTVTGGKGPSSAGGIYVAATDAGAGSLVTFNSTVSGNTGGGVVGAGVNYGDGASLTLRQSTISGNQGDGVGTFYYANARVIDSTIANNTGTGVDVGFKGRASLLRSTISGNKAGGVAAFFKGNVTISNSTVSGNSYAGDVGGGVYLGLDSGAVIVHSTITGNSAAKGGGIAAYSTEGPVDFELERSIVSGNKAAEGPEIFVYEAGGLQTSNFSLIGQGGEAGVVEFTPGSTDIVPTQPIGRILNTRLAANGGPTGTHALVARSPAIDAITDGTCPPPAGDQRRVIRPRDGNGDGGPACDIGAFER